MNDFNDFNETDENTIIELNTMDEETSALDNIEAKEINTGEIKISPKKEKKKKTKKYHKSWYDLTKKQKILIILIPALILLVIIVSLLLYFFVFKKDNDPIKEPIEDVILEKDNYIYKNGVLELLDKDDEIIGTYDCTIKDAKKCFVASFTEEDSFDVPTYLNEDNEKISKIAKIYNNRYAFISDNDVIYLYDLKDKKNLDEYKLIKTGDNTNNVVAFKDKDNKYGIIKLGDEVKTIIKPEYEYLGIYNSEKLFVVKEEGFTYLIDETGKTRTNKLKGEIRSFNDKYVSVYNEGYYLYNYSGLTVIDEALDFIDFVDGYVATISEGKMYIYDNSMFKVNENGIKIKNNEYIPTYIFDENNTLKDTKRSYKITVNGDEYINVEQSDKSSKKINLYEVTVSKKQNFITYLDGTLYFYSDKEKENLLGSYTCTNKNVVKGPNSELKTCYVATSTNILSQDSTFGYIPIIGNEYVFIYDTKEGLGKTNIVLYDLKNKTVLAKYQKVDTTARYDSLMFVDKIEDFIIAQNSDGDYGIIEIKGEGPKGLIKFKGTKSISYFKAKYLLVKRDDYYLFDLANLDEENKVAESKFQITDYKDGNMVVKDDKYTVYSKDGAIIKSGFDYASLEDTFAIGIIDNALNLYSLSDTKPGEKILKGDDIKLITKDEKYENFHVKADSTYVIEILKEDGTYQKYEYDLGGNKIEKE